MKRLAKILLCLCLSGCVSVPLSTIVRMSSFDERDFALLDAEVVRVKVTLPSGFGLDVGRSWLGVELTSPAGSHQSAFELEQERVQVVEIPGGVLSRAQAGTAYTLRLTATSKAKFRELQAFINRGRANQVTIRVVPRLSSFPKETDSVTVWIDLLLSATQGYFTLVDAATLPMERLRE